MKEEKSPQALPPDELAIQEGLRQLALESRIDRPDRPERPLPAASDLWWRAEILSRWNARDDAAREAERPIVWGRAAAGVAALLIPLCFFESAPWLMAGLAALGMPLIVLVAWLFLQRET